MGSSSRWGLLGDPNWKNLLAAWQERNGNADARPVYSGAGIAMYTTKQVAHNEVILSDTITQRKFKALASDIVVSLEPEL
jgi:hypothetical protein